MGGEKTDDAFAKTWGDYSQPSDPDQQGGKYIVALCRRLQEEGLSLEEVDDEIDGRVDGTYVRSKLNTTSGTVVTGVEFSTDTDNRYLYISLTTTSAITSLTANSQ